MDNPHSNINRRYGKCKSWEQRPMASEVADAGNGQEI